MTVHPRQNIPLLHNNPESPNGFLTVIFAELAVGRLGNTGLPPCVGLLSLCSHPRAETPYHSDTQLGGLALRC